MVNELKIRSSRDRNTTPFSLSSIGVDVGQQVQCDVPAAVTKLICCAKLEIGYWPKNARELACLPRTLCEIPLLWPSFSTRPRSRARSSPHQRFPSRSQLATPRTRLQRATTLPLPLRPFTPSSSCRSSKGGRSHFSHPRISPNSHRTLQSSF